MTRSAPELSLDPEQEYRAIEHALLETARGRWFLAEHGHKSRRMETSQLERALGQLKSSLRDPPAVLGRLKAELEDAQNDIADARARVLARAPLAQGAAPGMADPQNPAAGILKAAEELHELAWSLHSGEVDPAVCERIARQTSHIFALSVRQAQEAQRARAFADDLDRIGQKIESVLASINLEAKGEPEPVEPPAPRSFDLPGLEHLDALLSRKPKR